MDVDDLPDPEAALAAVDAAPFVVSLELRHSPITDRADVFLALASVVADEMYERAFPMVAVDREVFDRLESGQRARIGQGGIIDITAAG